MFNGHETHLLHFASSSNSHRISSLLPWASWSRARRFGHFSLLPSQPLRHRFPRSFLIITLNLLINPQLTFLFPSIKIAKQPGGEPRESEVERATDRSVWLQPWSSSPSLTDGSCFDAPLFHKTQVFVILTQDLKFCLFFSLIWLWNFLKYGLVVLISAWCCCIGDNLWNYFCFTLCYACCWNLV